MSHNIALYIHFPFCRRKCSYCSFVSYQHREADIPAYVNALKKELALRGANQQVHTIYFGGGTPSLLSIKQISEILSTIHLHFAIDKAVEITIEANPGTIDQQYLADIRALGINRLSLGVQSLEDSDLRLLSRIHTAAEAKDAILFARNTGFTNLSLDLIYGLPEQTLSCWQKTLTEAIEFHPEHISLYPLSLEGNVPMQLAIERGEIPAPDPDYTADQYELAEEILESYGYLHYEISNWAIAGWECQHNLVYWKNLPYLGAGAAAHSYMDGHRFANTGDLDSYLNTFLHNAPLVHDVDEEIEPELQLAESIIMGLRLDEGVSLSSIRTIFGIDLLKQYGRQVGNLVSLELLEYADERIRLTPRGRLLGNEVFWQFLPG